MKKFLTFATFSLVALPVLVLADFDLTNWQYEKNIQVPALGSAQYVRLPLDSDVSAGRDFRDVRVINSSGVETPYQLILEEYVSKYARGVLLNNSTDSQGRTSFVLDLGASGVIHNQISIETLTSDYRRQVSVYSADSLLADSSSGWRLLTDKGYIFKFSDETADFRASGNLVTYPKNTSRYLRVVIGSGSEGAIKVLWATVVRQEARTNLLRDLEISGSIGNDQNNKATVLSFDLGSAGIFTSKVSLKTNNKNFSRRVIVESSNDGVVWNFLSQGYISQLQTPLFSGGSLTIQYPEIKARYVRVKVFNQDDQALSFEASASFKSSVYAVIFEAQQNLTYKLYYGNSHATTPHYDLSRLFQYLETDGLAEAKLGSSVLNSSYVPPAPPVVPFTESNKYLLNGLLVVLVIAIGGLIFFYLRKTVRINKTPDQPDGPSNFV